jgi:hypothetical protein
MLLPATHIWYEAQPQEERKRGAIVRTVLEKPDLPYLAKLALQSTSN